MANLSRSFFVGDEAGRDRDLELWLTAYVR